MSSDPSSPTGFEFWSRRAVLAENLFFFILLAGVNFLLDGMPLSTSPVVS